MNVGKFYQKNKIDLKVPEDYCIPVQGGVEDCTWDEDKKNDLVILEY